ncbi:branched-chain amino acid transport system substrate-binding protein [Mycoplana sp. BE70]|uniref:ABC transporter substrate-binding protein n=1 Tax=Mycoplana sp. BE70 TaxID=2817775 RepID=UPI0028596627|nr:ABC transporter substrate-binding protein [Mycoplana sp. BE70]MDR6755840.1 branched-chain amino acid transport system substrate-binding protein [Mycoplana sp. BE70]
MTFTSTRRAILGAVAASALLAAGVAPVAAADPIKIGSVVSATGSTAFLGDPEAKTLKLVADQINAKGGILGRPIELILYDDGGDANKALTYATRLVEDDGVVAMVGGTSTGATMAMVPVFEDAEIPFISLAGAIEIIDPVNPFVFKTPHTDKTACMKIFEDMKARGLMKIGMISGTDGFGKSMRNQCMNVIGDYGIEVLVDESYGPTDADMTPQLNKIKNTEGIQAIVNPGFGQGPAIVTRNYAQLGLTAPLYQSHGVASKSFIELAGKAAEGVRLPAPALLIADKLADDDKQKPVVTAYKQAYEAATGQPVSTFGGYAYDGLSLLAAAIEKAGSDDPAAIRDAIEATNGYVGVTGIYTMSAEDHLGLGTESFRLLRIENGDWVPETAAQ